MALDLEEQEQLAALKAWWKDNANLVLGLITAVALGFAGYQGWHWYQRSQALQASTLYESLAKATQANDAKGVRDAAGALAESYPRTLYASMGALASARFHFDRNDLKTAKVQLQWVIERSKFDDLRDIARLRLAAMLLDEKAYDEALQVLGAEVAPAQRVAVADRRGDVLFAQGKLDEARKAYQQALDLAEPGHPLRGLVQLKLDALPAAS